MLVLGDHPWYDSGMALHVDDPLDPSRHAFCDGCRLPMQPFEMYVRERRQGHKSCVDDLFASPPMRPMPDEDIEIIADFAQLPVQQVRGLVRFTEWRLGVR